MFFSRKVWLSIAWAVVFLLTIETALQIRSHIRYGSSVFKALAKETTYKFNEDFALKMLRPNSVIQGSQATIKTNSLGLRSPELPLERQANEFRVAVLGASTVMGTYTRHNEEVLSYRLQHYLQQIMPEKDVRVINGGIAGYGIDEQRLMLGRVLAPYNLDLLIWYPGFNDVSNYCRQPEPHLASHGIPGPKLPSWLLSVELVVKNTIWLRSVRAGKKDKIQPSTLNLTPYRQKVNQLLDVVQELGLGMIIVTNSRAFRENMPYETQMRLSETARYYNHCFDLMGLHEVYDVHNEILADVGTKRGIPVFRMNQVLPGGDEYFGDATHFSISGTDYVARLLTKEIESIGYTQLQTEKRGSR